MRLTLTVLVALVVFGCGRSPVTRGPEQLKAVELPESVGLRPHLEDAVGDASGHIWVGMQTVDRGYRVRRFDGAGWSEPGGQLYSDTGAQTWGLRLAALPDGRFHAAWESDGEIAVRQLGGDAWSEAAAPLLGGPGWPVGLLPSADGKLLMFAGAEETVDGEKVYRWLTLEQSTDGWRPLGSSSTAHWLIRGGDKLLRLELFAGAAMGTTRVAVETWANDAWVQTHETTLPVPPDAPIRAAATNDALYFAYAKGSSDTEVTIELTRFQGGEWSPPAMLTEPGKVAVLHSLRVSPTEGPALLVQRTGAGSPLELLFWDETSGEVDVGSSFFAYPAPRFLADARLVRTLDGSLSAAWREAPASLVASDGNGMTRIFIARFPGE